MLFNYTWATCYLTIHGVHVINYTWATCYLPIHGLHVI